MKRKQGPWSGTIVLKPRYYYLHLRLDFGPLATANPSTSREQLRQAFLDSLHTLFGVVTASKLAFTLLPPFQAKDTEKVHPDFILRAPADHHKRIWAAVTLLTSISERPVRVVVLRATPFPFALDSSDDWFEPQPQTNATLS